MGRCDPVGTKGNDVNIHISQPPLGVPRLQARLAASTRELGRLAAIAMHPRTRARISYAKTELQWIAVHSRDADSDAIESLLPRLHAVDTTLEAISRAIDAFGRQALLPIDASSTPTPNR